MTVNADWEISENDVHWRNVRLCNVICTVVH